MVSPEEITLVQSSWQQVAPISDTAADLFYGKLFELDPSLQELFPAEMAEQKKKLMQTLAFAVNGLNDLEKIVPAVQTLGERHVHYKVKDEHYGTVGAALLWTLQQGLGEGWNEDLASAWTTVYTVLSTTMKTAAAGVAG